MYNSDLFLRTQKMLICFYFSWYLISTIQELLLCLVFLIQFGRIKWKHSFVSALEIVHTADTQLEVGILDINWIVMAESLKDLDLRTHNHREKQMTCKHWSQLKHQRCNWRFWDKRKWNKHTSVIKQWCWHLCSTISCLL